MSNAVPTVACTNCGKNFTTDDLRGTACKYCGTLLAHHARAQEQIAVINGMMADRNGNGIPDMYEGVVANAQANAMNQAFGMGNPYGPPAGGMGMGMGMGPMGAPMGMGMGMNPYAANQIGQSVARTTSAIMMVVVISIVVITLLSVGIGVFVFAMAR